MVSVVAILLVFSANNLFAQEKLQIPKWLSTNWYGADAKYTDEWLFEVTNKVKSSIKRPMQLKLRQKQVKLQPSMKQQNPLLTGAG
jgi:hypothetical protein